MPHNKNDWSCITIFHFIIWMIILSESHFHLKYTITLRDPIRKKKKKSRSSYSFAHTSKAENSWMPFFIRLEFFTPDSTNDY